jgi:hypothetical protein
LLNFHDRTDRAEHSFGGGNSSLRDYMRSESENSFDMTSVHRARVATAYRSPQHRALAHSFRYMRNKPAIVALNTPSVDDRRKSNESILTIGNLTLLSFLSSHMVSGTK